jgi:hypothetical protein
VGEALSGVNHGEGAEGLAKDHQGKGCGVS